MKSRDFCYWLQGFFEIADTLDVNRDQVHAIQQHLKLVFEHEIDPSIDKNNLEVKNKLNSIHESTTTIRC